MATAAIVATSWSISAMPKPAGAATANSSTPGSGSLVSQRPKSRSTTFTQGKMLVHEDFSDNHQNWSVAKDADTSLDLVHNADGTNEYAMTILSNSTTVHPVPELRGLKAAQVDNSIVSANFVNNLYVSSKDFFGVTCRDYHGSWYELGVEHLVSGGSLWLIVKETPNNQQTLASGSTGKTSLEIAGACVGGSGSGPAHLGVAIGGQEVGQATDAQPLKQGYSGVFAHTSSSDTTGNQPPVFSVTDWQLHAATAA
jgi:hypothetical protein